jgi:hypothetical protein
VAKHSTPPVTPSSTQQAPSDSVVNDSAVVVDSALGGATSTAKEIRRAVIIEAPPTSAPQPTNKSSGRGPCDVLTERATAFGSLSPTSEVDEAKALMAAIAVLSNEFEQLAPAELAGDAAVEAKFYRAVRELDGGATLDEYFTSFWTVTTEEIEPASQRIADWARQSCSSDIFRFVAKREKVGVCLAPATTDAERQAVVERVSVPTGRGTETEFIDGIDGYGGARNGFYVKFAANITEVRRTELLTLLSAPPVERILLGQDPMDPSTC